MALKEFGLTQSVMHIVTQLGTVHLSCESGCVLQVVISKLSGNPLQPRCQKGHEKHCIYHCSFICIAV